MRKFVLLAALALAVMYSYAQRPTVSNYWKSYSVQAEKGEPKDGSELLEGAVVPFKSANLVEESDIGETWYDKQSNRAVANRVYRYPDGTMAGVWIYGINATGFDDRGAGYNFYTGNEWGPWPTSRIETVKCGWPSYAPLGENGEIVVSHDAATALYINRRTEKGTGAWTETTIQGPPGYEKVTWPRVMTEGADNNIVHVLGQIRDYPASGDMTLGYYRSNDGAETWDLLNYEIPGTGPDSYTEVGADSYTFAEPRNGVIAFFIANLWCDAFIMKSTDHGDTWEKVMVWEHPYPFYDDNTVFTDTLWAPDNSGHIALDSEGKAHVVFGLGFIIKSEVGTTYTHYPGYQDGIVYWNEDMPPFEYADQHDALDPYDVLEEDVNLIGWSPDVNGNGELDFTDDIISYSEIGLSTMPNIAIDDQNRIYVAWATTTEGYDNGVNNFKHIWARSAIDPEMGWSDFHDLTGDLIHIFDECVYPQFTPLTDENLYMMFNLDLSPGNAVDGDHDYQQNKQVWMTINKDEILSVGAEIARPAASVSQNFPNPCNGSTVIQVDLAGRSPMSVHVYDLMGREVAQHPEAVYPAGTHTITLSVAHLVPGVYVYAVEAGDAVVNRKLIVE